MKSTGQENVSLFRSELFLFCSGLSVFVMSVFALIDVVTGSRSSFGRFAFMATLILAPALSLITGVEISVRHRKTVRMIGAAFLSLLGIVVLGVAVVLLPAAHD